MACLLTFRYSASSLVVSTSSRPSRMKPVMTRRCASRLQTSRDTSINVDEPGPKTC